MTPNTQVICFPSAAATAKVKVKSMFGGGGDAKKPSKSGGTGGIGGIGGLFPSAGDSGSGGKEKKGGLIGGLFAAPQNEMNPGAAGGAGEGAGGSVGGSVGGGVGGGTEGMLTGFI